MGRAQKRKEEGTAYLHLSLALQVTNHCRNFEPASPSHNCKTGLAASSTVQYILYNVQCTCTSIMPPWAETIFFSDCRVKFISYYFKAPEV